jgi:hypothetical protein
MEKEEQEKKQYAKTQDFKRRSDKIAGAIRTYDVSIVFKKVFAFRTSQAERRTVPVAQHSMI